jgi:hypothetical protein
MGTLFSILFFFSSCMNQAEPETHLIPKDYKGYVIVIFDEKNGVPKKYENGSRVYEIPSDGVLRTQFRKQKGWIAPGKVNYYYYDNSERQKLEYLQSTQGVKDDSKIYVFSEEISGKTVRYLIGNLSEGDTYFNALRKKIEELFPPEVQ